MSTLRYMSCVREFYFWGLLRDITRRDGIGWFYDDIYKRSVKDIKDSIEGTRLSIKTRHMADLDNFGRFDNRRLFNSSWEGGFKK